MASPHDWNASLADFDLEAVSPTPPTSAVVVTPVAMAELLERAGLVAAFERHAGTAVPITLVVNDAHRPTDSHSFLTAVFSLLDAKLPSKAGLRFRLLVASGTHVDDASERKRHEARVLGTDTGTGAGTLADRFESVAWNDADDAQQQTTIGDYLFHEWMGQGGLYIACGSTEPHYFAGVTGAHKTLTVGVMARASIQANHAHAMDTRAGGLVLDGNPVHEGIVAAVTALVHSGAELWCLNQLVVDGEAAAAWAGAPLDALAAALPTVREVFAHSISAPADVIIATVHAPLDRDLYQADKGIKNTEAALADGGILLVDAACTNGVGIGHFLDLLRAAQDYESARAIVRQRGYRLGDHKAVRLRALTDRRRIRLAILSPNLDASLEQVLGARIFADIDTASRWIRQEAGDPGATRAVWVKDAGNITLESA